MYGVLERAAHFVPLLVLLELLLLLVERTQSLVDHLQQFVNLVTLALCARVQNSQDHTAVIIHLVRFSAKYIHTATEAAAL